MDEMLFTMVFITILIASAMVLGIIAGLVTLMLDNIMDKGHILDFLRIWKFKKLGGVISDTRGQSFGERVNYYNDEYWKVAFYKKSFMNWICPICMSIKIGWFLGALIYGIVFYYTNSSHYLEGLFLFFVYTFVVAVISYATVRIMT